MNKIKVRFNDISDKLLKVDGFYGEAKRGNIIEVGQEGYERRLKNWKNLNGENIFIPVEPVKKVVKEEKEEEKQDKNKTE